MYDVSTAIQRLLKPLSLRPERNASWPDRFYHGMQHRARVLGFRLKPLRVFSKSYPADALSREQVVSELNHLRGMAATGAGTIDTSQQALELVARAAGQHLGIGIGQEQLRSAWACLRGGVAVLQGTEARRQVLALAAATGAALGFPVILLFNSMQQCRQFQATFGFLCAHLNLRLGLVSDDQSKTDRGREYGADIVCTSMRQAANDYLLDRLLDGSNQKLLGRRLESLLRPASATARLMHPAPGLVFVDSADYQLIDLATTPVSVSGGDGHFWTGPVIDRAYRLASSLAVDVDYQVCKASQTVTLTAQGKERLGALAESLPKLWRADLLREVLVTEALAAKELLERGSDYDIDPSGLVLLRGQHEAGRPDLSRERLQFLKLWNKAGDSMDPELLARTYVQRFLSRYGLVGGVAAYVGIAGDVLWREYGCPVIASRVLPGFSPRHLQVSVVPEPARLDTVLSRVQAYLDAGKTVLLPVRERHLYRQLGSAMESCLRSLPPSREMPRMKRFGADRGEGSVLLVPEPEWLIVGQGRTDEPSHRQIDAVLLPEEPDCLRSIARLVESDAGKAIPETELLLSTKDSLLQISVSGRLLATLARRGVKRRESIGAIGHLLLWYALKHRERMKIRALRDSGRADDNFHRLLAFAGGGK